MTVRTLLRTGGLILLVALAGCDLFGPSGPGTLEAVVETPRPLGGLILEVRGAGITGFEGRGTTRAFGQEVSAAEGRHRLVLVVPEGGEIRFGILLDDLGADPPSLRIIGAVSPQDLPVQARDVRVRVD